MPTPPTSFLSDLLTMGYAKEAIFGTALLPTNWIPAVDVKIDRDPRVIYPKLMRGSRAGQPVAVNGIRRLSGTLTAPLFPDAGMGLLAGSIGAETKTEGTVPGSPVTGTLAAQVNAGATTFTSTAVYTVGQLVQVGQNVDLNPEIRKISAVTTGTPNSYTVDKAFSFTHGGGATVALMITPVTHLVFPSNALPSWTIEKNMSGGAAGGPDLQYAGTLVSKTDLRLALQAEAQVTYTIDSQIDTILGTPSTAAEPADQPYGPGAISINLAGQQDTTASVFELTVDNAAIIKDAFNGNDYPTLIIPGSRKITGRATVFLQALSGTYGYYAYLNTTPTVPRIVVAVTLTQAPNSCTLTLPAAALSRAPQVLRYGDIIMQDLEFTATVGGTNNDDIEATIVSSSYLQY